MKKIIITLILAAGVVFYSYLYARRPSTVAMIPATSSTPADLGAALAEQQALEAQVATLSARVARLEGSSTAPSPTPAPMPMMPAPKPKPMMSQYKDGTYQGSIADAYYGSVQVQATISGGRITNVTFLSYPSTHSTSVYINSQAMPILTQEAITAQSAHVNIVSGATDTSQAFIQSLSAALASARA